MDISSLIILALLFVLYYKFYVPADKVKYSVMFVEKSGTPAINWINCEEGVIEKRIFNEVLNEQDTSVSIVKLFIDKDNYDTIYVRGMDVYATENSLIKIRCKTFNKECIEGKQYFSITFVDDDKIFFTSNIFFNDKEHILDEGTKIVFSY